MPVFLARSNPDHVPRVDFLDRTIPVLHTTAASSNDQGLAQGMSMPGSPSSWLKGDISAEHAGRCGRIEQGVNTDSAGKILGCSIAGRL